MSVWCPIERIVPDEPIWVLKYDVYFTPEGNFCDADYPGAQKFTDCHGWYDNEDDAMAVLRHFTRPNSYRMEKVHRRALLATPTTQPRSAE